MDNKMDTLYLDTETFSHVPIKDGTYAYAADCSIILFSYAIDDGPAQVWDPDICSMPDDLADALSDESVTIIAHNAMFDRTVLNCNQTPTDINRWRCSMVKALSVGLPGSLDQLGAAMGLPDDQRKLKDGKKLINRFCKPAPKSHKVDRYDRHNSPEEWSRFVEYARRDVEIGRTLWGMIPSWNYRNSEVDLWHLDQQINDNGLPVDLAAVDAAINLVNSETEKLEQRITTLTGGAVTSATQVKNMLSHLEELGV